MARGERVERKLNNAGRDYWKKKGFLSKCWGWLQPVSSRAGVNKITKRHTNKSERQQVKKYINTTDFKES